MSSLCDKWMPILKGRFHCFQLSSHHFKGKIFLRTFSFHFESLKRHVLISVMGNERLKNWSVDYTSGHICLKSDILLRVTNWFSLVPLKPKHMHSRWILIGLTYLKPFITIGDKKNFLGKVRPVLASVGANGLRKKWLKIREGKLW